MNRFAFGQADDPGHQTGIDDVVGYRSNPQPEWVKRAQPGKIQPDVEHLLGRHGRQNDGTGAERNLDRTRPDTGAPETLNDGAGRPERNRFRETKLCHPDKNEQKIDGEGREDHRETYLEA